MSTPQAGWYPDPAGNATKLRYWDGTQWTEYYAEAQPAADPVTASGTAEGAQYAAGQSVGCQPATGAYYGTGPVYAPGPTYAPEPTYTGGPAYSAGPTPAAPYATTGNEETLRLVAFIFAVLCTISVCWLIIPLAWMIPMTVRSWGIYKGTKPNTTAFGVCTLIFLSLVSGILLLVSKKDA